nr:MAG TPA: hypothetical protein [Caudoviricetes sp.]
MELDIYHHTCLQVLLTYHSTNYSRINPQCHYKIYLHC